MQFAGVFLVTLFGLWNVVRAARHFRTEKLIENAAMTKIVAAFLAWILLCAAFFARNVGVFSVCVTVFPLFLQLLPRFLRLIRTKRKRADVLAVVRQTILKIKIGHSFHQALALAPKCCREASQPYIQQIADLTVIDGAELPLLRDPLTIRTLCVWRRCHQEPHLALGLLDRYAYSLELEEKFSRKLEAATQQSRAQAVIALLLFSALVAWVHWQFGLERYIGLVIMASVVHVAGIAAVLNGGRRMKWKV